MKKVKGIRKENEMEREGKVKGNKKNYT